MKTKGVLAVILTAVLCISGNLLAYTDGDGSPENPYQIANKADLLELATDAGNYDKCFILTANIDLAGESFTQAVIAPDTDTADEFGEFLGIQFTGVFDGSDHTISNLTITTSERDFIGLFGAVGTGSQVMNIGVENVNITGRTYVGGLVGINYGTSTITSCYATGTVSGGWYVGGLVGASNTGTITSCYATGSVSGTGDSSYVGGLVGLNDDSTLTSCYATGTVSGTDYFAGGLVGYNSDGTLTSCYATGSVLTISVEAGGLVGFNYDGTLTSCYATGTVSGGWYVGGLVGKIVSGTITSCYATGSVTSDGTSSSYVGGLVGLKEGGEISFCYATGDVSGTGTHSYVYVGGLLGSSDDSVISSFWDKDTSGTSDGVSNVDPDPAGVQGKTTDQMQTQATFTGWDFVGETINGTADTWKMRCEGMNYPKLTWQQVQTGDFECPDGVNYIDFAVLAAYWEHTGCPTGCEKADINNSGTVDSTDLMIFADNWLKGI